LIKWILKFIKAPSSNAWGFFILDWKNFESAKNDGGRGDYTRIFIADTRRCAQFSLGGENLIHRANSASGF
jgi:hypothetical protein